MVNFIYNPNAKYIFNAVIEEQGYSPIALFDGVKTTIGQTLLIFEDNSIYLDRVALDEDIKAAKFVVFSGKNYQVGPNQFAVSPVLPTDIVELLADTQYNIYLEEIILD